MIFPFRSLLRGWRATLLLAAVVCASPGRASAECGDYVVILNANTQAVANDHSAHHPVATTDEMPALPRTPCSGPNCSRKPDHPTPPFAPVVTSASSAKEATPILTPTDPADRTSARVGDFISPRPIRRASSVFHPPRAG